jgi:putative glycosyltransferase (TIGR04372 family)
MVSTPVLRSILLLSAARSSIETRHSIIEICQRANVTQAAKRAFAIEARRLHERNVHRAEYLDCYTLAMAYSAEAPEAWSLLSSESGQKIVTDARVESRFFALGVSLGFELARYRDVVRIARDAVDRSAASLRPRYDYLKAAFAAGKLRREREALEFFGRQYNLIGDSVRRASDADLERVVETFQRHAVHTISSELFFQNLRRGGSTRTGIFFLSSTEALGHAILDPYYFIALNRDRFDSLVFIGPSKASYRPASRACLNIIEQYGEYMETGSDMLMNLSWMSLGHHAVGSVTCVVDHYWALLRQAVHRTRDPADEFRHNGWHFSLPSDHIAVGEEFCRGARIALDQPLVVLHVRDPGYHGIIKQSYRDATAENYREAIEHLLDGGYQVARIGDASMPRIEIDRPGYFELPFMPGYRHEADAFLISRARFMISSQSGPCAFARVLGTPVLTVNAVLHYTLLPSSREMACFKRYYRKQDGTRRELSLEEAIDARVFHFENSYQFDEAKIVFEEASSEEILASVQDMIRWLDEPKLPETVPQRRFRARVEAMAAELKEAGQRLDLPIADYLGISLPGYRIAPTVADMREKSQPSVNHEDRQAS